MVDRSLTTPCITRLSGRRTLAVSVVNEAHLNLFHTHTHTHTHTDRHTPTDNDLIATPYHIPGCVTLCILIFYLFIYLNDKGLEGL